MVNPGECHADQFETGTVLDHLAPVGEVGEHHRIRIAAAFDQGRNVLRPVCAGDQFYPVAQFFPHHLQQPLLRHAQRLQNDNFFLFHLPVNLHLKMS